MTTHKKGMELDVARKTADRIEMVLQEAGHRVKICGSIRRRVPTVHDIDVVVSFPMESVVAALERIPTAILLSNRAKALKTTQWLIDGIQVDVYGVFEDAWGAMTMFLTGSQMFNVLIRGEAKKQGYRLNQYGLFHHEDLIAAKTERLIFDALGLEWMEPEDRSKEGHRTMKKMLRKKGV